MDALLKETVDAAINSRYPAWLPRKKVDRGNPHSQGSRKGRIITQ